jgi:hypothetical protein
MLQLYPYKIRSKKQLIEYLIKNYKLCRLLIAVGYSKQDIYEYMWFMEDMFWVGQITK